MPPPPAQLFATRVLLGPALRAQPDRRLVDLVREGYDSAFEEIVRRYRRPLDRFAASMVAGSAEDVTQDAFSKALQALRKSEAEIELRPWLYRIVRNTALNDLRDRGPSGEQLLESLPGSAGADAAAERREELVQLMRRLGELPEAQRAAIVMRELEGLSHEEIANALGVSGGAARQAIHRARSALRDGLGLLVPMPVLRTIADGGGEAVGAAAGGAGMAGAGLGAGAFKVGIATVLVAGSVAGGVAIRDHDERVGPEAAAASPRPGLGAQPLATAPRPGEQGGAGSPSSEGLSGEEGEAARHGEGHSGSSGPSAGLAASQAGASGSGPRRHATAEDGGSEDDGGGSHSGPGGGANGGDDHGGLDDNNFEDHSGPGGGGDDGLQSGGHGGSGEDSSGSGSSGGSGESLESGSGSSGSGSSDSGSSGPGSSDFDSSGAEDGGSLEPTTDSGSPGSGSGDFETSGSGSGPSSDELLSSGS
jgi:RNA polymerase sigma factor (sigma-70 family)